MRQLKDREWTEATIKITKVQKLFKDKNIYTSKDKLRCVKITKPTVITSTCFPDDKKGNRELIKFIKKELYIK